MATRITLKTGALGDVYCESEAGTARTARDLSGARWPWLARHLARREARALTRLGGIDGVPALLTFERDKLIRSFLPGQPMHRGEPPTAEYFKQALRLLRRLHARKVAHNDLAKEANWIRRDDGTPAIVDFQLSGCFTERTRVFRMLAREDLRHLLKHKQHYLPDSLTSRERSILAKRLWHTQAWRVLVKPCYLFVTRRLLGWPERDGAEERERLT